ncbi:uncharacterized protein LOC125221319 [Salvia hispanica]|uniref:uncharacterized protein LOC125221319 n=1 Tax=Salvia hispanica TaxID=49212 RepID=UPI002008F690|nr:uncharacterized protein LOC125221319 [Salvia hispanica]
MNPESDDWSTSDGSRRALTRALFDCVKDAATECLAQMECERAAAEQVAAARVPWTYVPHEHDVAHQRLVADYFAKQPRWGRMGFHRHFRMRRDFFLRIVRTLEGRDEYFQYREDGIADMLDEYLYVGETTSRDCLNNFCRGVVEAFGETYLRRPTADDCQSLIRMHETVHGFLGMLGSIECMHWQ